ncbi:MAG: DUF6596 domain-containing protein [Myxococcota bacterium]
MNAAQRIERAARESYGRLLGYLARESRDLAACEDALGDAFVSALETWGRNGVPQRPDAWLLTAARNRLRSAARHGAVRKRAASLLALLNEEALDTQEITVDARVPLMFVCAHPAIDTRVRTPLMLQTVLGLDAATIARTFMVSPASMAKRLVRAKAKIKQAHISFELPGPELWAERLQSVLDAIYGAYGQSWDFAATAEDHAALSSEAIHLAELIALALPNEAEAQALLALLLYCEARSNARVDGDRFVALEQQDTQRWDLEMIAHAEQHLRAASTHGTQGRYQLEAALQSCHVARRLHGIDNRAEVELLYEALVELTGALGAKVGYCAAIATHRGAAAGLKVLACVQDARLATHQPYWALRGELCAQLGKRDSALEAYSRAVGLTITKTVRDFLLRRMATLDRD